MVKKCNGVLGRGVDVDIDPIRKMKSNFES
jgi:hypothetical protein